MDNKDTVTGAPATDMLGGNQIKNQGEEQIPKPTNNTDLDQQNNIEQNIAAAQNLPAAAPVATLINQIGALADAYGNTDPLKNDTIAIPATTNALNHNGTHPSLPSEHLEPSMVSPFEMAAPPGNLVSAFSRPAAEITGQLSQPRNSSLDSAGSASRRHHLLRHTLPAESIGNNAVHHFGVTTVQDALRAVQKMSQRDLQQAFERVYNVKSSSNNNNWLRKKLVEGKRNEIKCISKPCFLPSVGLILKIYNFPSSNHFFSFTFYSCSVGSQGWAYHWRC